MTAFVQVLTRRLVSREMTLDDLPESLRMIHLDQMREFVNDNVVDDFLRRLNQSPVQPDLASGIATAPLRAGV